MLVPDQPLAADLAETHGRAHPSVRFLAVGPLPTDPGEAPAERDVRAGRDAEVVNVEPDRPLECRKPSGQVLSEGIPSYVLQWWREIEGHDVRRIVSDDTIEGLGADDRGQVSHELANPRFIVRLTGDAVVLVVASYPRRDSWEIHGHRPPGGPSSALSPVSRTAWVRIDTRWRGVR